MAIKTLKEGMGENDEVRFLQEAAINGQFQHRNVVNLHGVVTLGKPVSTYICDICHLNSNLIPCKVMIVLELLHNGDLRNFLVRSRPL